MSLSIRMLVAVSLGLGAVACGGGSNTGTDSGVPTQDAPGGGGTACAASPLVGGWDIAAFPTGAAVLRFQPDCTFARTTGGSCTGRAVFQNVTASSGTVNITCEATGATSACTYAITAGTPRTMTFGCDGDSGDFRGL